jgi:hypothetical protein
MIDLDGHIEGPITATRDTALWGSVSGDVVIRSGVRLELYGKVRGDLIVEQGGVALVRGSVSGTVVNRGAHVVVFGRAESIRDEGEQATQIAPDAEMEP